MRSLQRAQIPPARPIETGPTMAAASAVAVGTAIAHRPEKLGMMVRDGVTAGDWTR
jgi:hypothetical protein